MSTDNLILRTVYLPPELDDKLRVEAFAKRTSKNDLIRKYIDLGMKAASREHATSKASGDTDALPGSIVARSRPSQPAPAKKAAKKTSAAKSAAKA